MSEDRCLTMAKGARSCLLMIKYFYDWEEIMIKQSGGLLNRRHLPTWIGASYFDSTIFANFIGSFLSYLTV